MILFIFIITLLCIYLRPFGLPIWLFSTLGAICAYVFNVVSFNDVAFVWEMVWDSSFTLIGLIIFAISLERLGFFNAIANFIIKLSSHKTTAEISTRKFYILIMLFGFVISAFFSNDGAILILTPLLIALFRISTQNKDSIKPFIANATKSNLNSESCYTHNQTAIFFLLCMSFVSDFGSNLFVFSNLTNIITTHTFSLPFLSFFLHMLLPQAFVFVATLAIFWLFFGSKLPKYLSFSLIDSNLPSILIVLMCFILLFVLVFGIIFGEQFGLPISFVALFVGLISAFMAIAKEKSAFTSILKDSPFSVVIFSLGLFIVVYGLKHIGLIDALQSSIQALQGNTILNKMLFISFGSSIGSSIINNLPMVMLGDLALKGEELYLVYSHLLGCNIGSKLTPIGSLATLLWLFSLKRYGIVISFFSYMKIAFFTTIFILLCSILGLYISVMWIV